MIETYLGRALREIKVYRAKHPGLYLSAAPEINQVVEAMEILLGHLVDPPELDFQPGAHDREHPGLYHGA